MFVPRWHGMGAAAAQCLSFLVAAVLTWALTRRLTPFQPHWSRLFVCLAMFVGVLIVGATVLSEVGLVVGLLVKVAMFAIAALLTLLWVTRWSLSEIANKARGFVTKVNIA